MKYIKKIIANPIHCLKVLLFNLINLIEPFISDKLFIRLQFRVSVGYWPNLERPRTFNEKLQWLKFNDIHPEYTQLVDKIEAKKKVQSIIGEKYVIPTIGVWNTIDEIDWDKLPNQFVIKATNDSGGVVVCKDKSKLDVEAAKNKLYGLGSRDYTRYNKEYPYKNVAHRYIAEEYMEDESGFELKDYKIFCSYGKPLFLFVATGRQINDTRFDFYDTNFNHLPVLNGHDNADVWPTKPVNFEEMLYIAGELSKGFPQIRIDLYNCNGEIYFGEMTFFHWSGLVPFNPRKWDYIFGEMINLPYEKQDSTSN